MFNRIRSHAPLILLALFATFFGFTATAFAQGAVNPQDETLGELARGLLAAVKSGHGWLAASLSVVLALGLAKKYVPASSKPGRFINSDVGGMCSAFVLAFAGAVATAAASFTDGAGMTLAITGSAFYVGLGAIGGFVALHKFATWFTATKFYQDKTPAWLKTAIAFGLGLIGSSAATVAKAEKAGDEAVAKNPPKGSGEYTDVE